MSTTGWTLPGRAQSIPDGNTTAWEDTEDALNYDPETYARHPTVGTSTGSDTSELLRLDQFGFEIPLGYRIDELWVRGSFLYAGSVGGSQNSEIRELSLFFNNTAQGDEKSENVPYLSTDDDPVMRTFGGPLSYWDVELTPQIVNDPAFAVQFRSWKSTNKATMRVYYLEMNIHFTALHNTYVRDGGIWKPGSNHVRDGGVWKPGQKTYVRDGGVWKS